MRKNGNRCSKFLYFRDQNWIPKTVYCIRCVIVCEIDFTNWNAKIAFLRASMVVSYYIKLFRTGTDRHNGILMSLLLLVAEIKNVNFNDEYHDLWQFYLVSVTIRSFMIFSLENFQTCWITWNMQNVI